MNEDNLRVASAHVLKKCGKRGEICLCGRKLDIGQLRRDNHLGRDGMGR